MNFKIDPSSATQIQIELLMMILASQRANNKLVVELMSKNDQEVTENYVLLNEFLAEETSNVLNRIYKDYGVLNLKDLGFDV
jgi:hypothetical protein